MGVHYTPEASKNRFVMKSITDKNCTVTFYEYKMVIRHRSTGKILSRQRCINGLYPVSIKVLLKVGDETS